MGVRKSPTLLLFKLNYEFFLLEDTMSFPCQDGSPTETSCRWFAIACNPILSATKVESRITSEGVPSCSLQTIPFPDIIDK